MVDYNGTSISRLPDWEIRLHEYYRRYCDVPFSWGRHDCATFVCGNVEALTGVDISMGLIGAYSTAEGAAEILAQFGCADVTDLCDKRIAQRKPVVYAQKGDIVAIATSLPVADWTHVLAVSLGLWCVLPGKDGYAHARTASADICWGV